MNAGLYSYKNLLETMKFLAEEHEMELSEFLKKVQERMEASKEKIRQLTSELMKLKSSDLERLLAGLDYGLVKTEMDPCASGKMPDKAMESETANQYEENEPDGRKQKPTLLLLSSYLDFQPGDLAKTRPVQLQINGELLTLKTWKDFIFSVIRHLINNNDLRRDMLPICPRSKKAFINFFPGQPPGVEKGGLFEQVCEQFYADVKYNAKYHILNIWKTLEILKLQDKYDIKLSLK